MLKRVRVRHDKKDEKLSSEREGVLVEPDHESPHYRVFARLDRPPCHSLWEADTLEYDVVDPPMLPASADPGIQIDFYEVDGALLYRSSGRWRFVPIFDGDVGAARLRAIALSRGGAVF